MSNFKTITVIGDGGWGTTLAVHLSKQKGTKVTLWGPFPKYVRQMAKNKYNSKFLPGIRLTRVQLEEDLTHALEGAGLIVFAVPSKFSSSIVEQICLSGVDLSKKVVLSVTKGFDEKTLTTISQLLEAQLNAKAITVLSGPTIAMEVAKGIPSSAVVAAGNLKLAKQLQELFNSETFRIYTNTDVLGVELGGSLKNIIALACGVCDGLGYGTNTKAAILTRGLAEMSRLGEALGAQSETFSGLSGLGDLVTTCFNEKSRNRSVGEKIGKGKSVGKILESMEQVAEGVEAAKGALEIAKTKKIPMPITQEVYNILYKKKKPAQAVRALMRREAKPE